MSDLHGEIMNLPCDPERLKGDGVFDGRTTAKERLAYRLGHRDARCAAAELASGHEAKRAVGLLRDEAFRSGAGPNYGHHLTIPREKPKSPANLAEGVALGVMRGVMYGGGR